MKTEAILNLDPIIHAPVRLAVLSVLITAEEADFNYHKEATATTDGNLSTHLNKLEEAELITIRKTFRGKKPRTTCRLTVKGRKAFNRYIDQLEQIIRGK